MLDRLNVDDFAPLVGDVFVVHADSLRLDLELIDAQTYAPGLDAFDASGMRSPFNLTFRGPAEPMLDQQIHRLEHESLGALEIFLVPLGPDGTGAIYEAVFA